MVCPFLCPGHGRKTERTGELRGSEKEKIWFAFQADGESKNLDSTDKSKIFFRDNVPFPKDTPDKDASNEKCRLHIKFETSLSYMRLCLKQNKTKQTLCVHRAKVFVTF